MKFLLDENRSPRLALRLTHAGYDAIHVSSAGLSRSPDPNILDFALRTQRILISGDTDFGSLLARTGQVLPSVILIRGQHLRDSDSQAEVLLSNLEEWRYDLEVGSLIVITHQRIRIRRLPLSLS